MLNLIFRDRDKWKRDTFELIKKNLLYIKDSRTIQYRQTSSTHLVCVYGKSQVGKTTLILNMIGLKDDKKSEVAEVLRGGIPRGNSSTSTAIIYSQSDNDQYGLLVETTKGGNVNLGVEYFSSEALCRKLQSIRDAVEQNLLSNEEIMHIFIPKKFFSDTVSTNKISILDLPGVESRNIKEKSHVESLMARYIPISSVCIIACPADTIQSLETLELPNDIKWNLLSDKFVIVTTKSYSRGNIKDFFQTPRCNRPKGFISYIQETYLSEVSKIPGICNSTQIFPIEIGDSFDKLLSEELTNEEDRNEVIQVRNSILDRLRQFVVEHKGENLLSAIKELKILVEQCDDSRIKFFNQQIEDNNVELSKLEEKLNHYNDDLNTLKVDKSQNESEVNDLRELYDSIGKTLNEATPRYSSDLIKVLTNSINDNNLTKRKSGTVYFCDKEQKILGTLSRHLASNLNLVKTANVLLSRCGLDISISDSTIGNQIYNDFAYKYSTKLYPDRSLINKAFGNGYPLLSEVQKHLENISCIIDEIVNNVVVRPCLSRIIKEKSSYEQKVEFLNSRIQITSRAVKRISNKIDDIRKLISDAQQNKKDAEQQLEDDKTVLESYLQFAKKAYQRQYNQIIAKINSNLPSEIKFAYILFLSVIEKDYNTFLNISNG